MCQHIWQTGKRRGQNCRMPLWKDDLCRRHHPQTIAEQEDEDCQSDFETAKSVLRRAHMLYVAAYMRKYEKDRFDEIAAMATPQESAEAERESRKLRWSDY